MDQYDDNFQLMSARNRPGSLGNFETLLEKRIFQNNLFRTKIKKATDDGTEYSTSANVHFMCSEPRSGAIDSSVLCALPVA